MSPRHREVGFAIIIDTQGRFLFHQRDDVPTITAPGKIGLFGGHREGDETFLQCAVREVHEEISIFVPPERFVHLWSYKGDDSEIAGGTVIGECYVVREVPSANVRVTEGSLLIAKREELPSLVPQLTDLTRAAIGYFLSKEQRA